MNLRNFVGGEYVAAEDGRTSGVVDPSTGEAYARPVWINTHIPFVSEMPHGGIKHSGYGTGLSMYGFEDRTRIKHVMSDTRAAA